MIKGISQDKRNAKWHKRHLLKLSRYKSHRVFRMFRYQNYGGGTARLAEAALGKLPKDKFKTNLTFFERIKLFFMKLFRLFRVSRSGTNLTASNI